MLGQTAMTVHDAHFPCLPPLARASGVSGA